MTLELFHIVLGGMTILALIVFIVLYRIEAGYGMLFNKRWGPPVNNKLAWILMESPVFIVMLLLWWFSGRRLEVTPLVFFLLFELHYFQRAFIFPFLIRGTSKMPLGIMLMGVIFNLINGYMQGTWIFYLSPEDMYLSSWLYSPQFVIGVILFFSGMIINIYSDEIIRGLRKPGDTGHYLPEKGMFRYVTSANYFGEIVEWIGFAVLTWSLSGVVFAIWTCANLIPCADAIYRKYQTMFGERVLAKKRIFPFLY